MDFTDPMKNAIVDWYRTNCQRPNAVASRHYLFMAIYRRNTHIIYGMDGPQKTYLAVQRVVSAWLDRGGSADGLLAEINREFGYKTRNKDHSPLVSNYFLEITSGDIQGRGAGVHLNRAARPEQAPPPLARNASGRDRRQHAEAVMKVQRETDRQNFTDRYTGSYFKLHGTSNEKQLNASQKNTPSRRGVSGGVAYFNDMYSFAVRRACKFLMYDSISEGKTVAYCLDDLDIGAIVERKWLIKQDDTVLGFETDRATAAQSGNFQKVPVCTTEVRELFRCWDWFGQSLQNGTPRVVFYRGFERTLPPWTSRTAEQALWAAYAKRLKDKWFPQLPAGVQQARKADADYIDNNYQGDHAGTIARYHALGIGAFKHGERALPAAG